MAGSLIQFAKSDASAYIVNLANQQGRLIMKRAFLSTFIGASALTLGLSVLPATATTTTAPADPTVPSATTTDPVNPAPAVDTTENDDLDEADAAGDRDFDWGWLGLLGLIGLAGLTRKHDEPVARYREPDEVSSSSNPRY